jgi:hypothetical protein
MKVTQKDKDFLMDTLNISNDELENMFSDILNLPEDGENSRESFVNSLCENRSGRDAYEIKKILLTRLFAE